MTLLLLWQRQVR